MRIPSFKSMSIATRLTGGFVSVLVLLAGVAATSNVAIRTVSSQMQQIVEVNNSKIELASGMLNSINQVGLHTRTVALLYDAQLIQQEAAAAEAAARLVKPNAVGLEHCTACTTFTGGSSQQGASAQQ